MDVDRVKCKTMKVDLNSVFETLQAFLGGYYVNDFNKFGRTWQVNVQADAPYRMNADVVRQFKVRNENGDMVPSGGSGQRPTTMSGRCSSSVTTC